MIGKLKELLRLSGGEWLVSFITKDDPRTLFDELKDAAVRIVITKASKHRSLSANAYAWVLIDQIAEKLQQKEPKNGWTVLEVYRNAIREIGGISDIYGVKETAVEAFKELWCGDHLGRQVQVIPGSSKPGWVNVKAWKGSSDFDSLQMTVFINGLIQEAEGLGIGTVSDKEVERMLNGWQKASFKKKENATSAEV